jgi:hypothetical protein
MKNYFFCILKVAEDFGTSPHPDPVAQVRIRGYASGSVPRCHGSETWDGLISNSGLTTVAASTVVLTATLYNVHCNRQKIAGTAVDQNKTLLCRRLIWVHRYFVTRHLFVTRQSYSLLLLVKKDHVRKVPYK